MSTESSLTNNLYVENLPHDITEDTIEQIFAAVGYGVAQCKVLKSPIPGATCVAMVRFKTTEEAKLVRENFDGTMLPGFEKPLQIRYAGSKPDTSGGYGKAEKPAWNGEKGGSQPYAAAKPPPEPSDNVYVRGLPPVADDAFAKELFGQFGTVIQCKVMTRSFNEPRHALIRFASIDEATKIISQLNGGVLEGSNDKLIIEYAARKTGTSDWQGAGSWGKGGGGDGGAGGVDPAMMGMIANLLAADGGAKGGMKGADMKGKGSASKGGKGWADASSGMDEVVNGDRKSVV